MQIISRGPIAATPAGDVAVYLTPDKQAHLRFRSPAYDPVPLVAPDLGDLLTRLRTLGEISIALESDLPTAEASHSYVLVFSIRGRPALAYAASLETDAALEEFWSAYPDIPVVATPRGLFSNDWFHRVCGVDRG